MSDKKIIKRDNIEEMPFLDAYIKNENNLLDGAELKKNCKLCNSKLKESVEAKFSETGSYKSSHKIIQDSGEDITYASTRRHLLHHFIEKERLLELGDYASNIQNLLSCPKNRVQSLRERIAMLENRMYKIELATEGEPLEEMRKSVDSLKKISDTIIAHESEIEKIRHQGEPVKLLINNFRAIMSEELKGADQAVKTALMNVFNKLIQSVSDIVIDKED